MAAKFVKSVLALVDEHPQVVRDLGRALIFKPDFSKGLVHLRAQGSIFVEALLRGTQHERARVAYGEDAVETGGLGQRDVAGVDGHAQKVVDVLDLSRTAARPTLDLLNLYAQTLTGFQRGDFKLACRGLQRAAREERVTMLSHGSPRRLGPWKGFGRTRTNGARLRYPSPGAACAVGSSCRPAPCASQTACE